MNAALADSYGRFEIPGIAEVVPGNGGLPKVRITTSEGSGEMYLHGAHVTSWKPAGEDEVLFLSAKSQWEDGRAIRGGVPICFPWFRGKTDDPKAPAHGFVRTKAWQIESITQEGGAVTVSMFTESDEGTKKWWPAEFRLVHRATFGSELSLELEVTNTGKTSLRFEEALHAYFRVGNVEMTRTQAPDAFHYYDKTDVHTQKTQLGEIMITSETDRVYLETRDPIEVEDPVLQRRIRVTKENSLNTVVWNPWEQKAASISDLAKDEWTQMLCIEPSNVLSFAVELAPGQQHTMKAVVRVVEF
jgi:glucose-6-phosphate 1-epimerase